MTADEPQFVTCDECDHRATIHYRGLDLCVGCAIDAIEALHELIDAEHESVM